MSIQMTSDHTELTFQYMRLEGQVETLLDFLLRRFRYLDDQEWRKNIKAKRLWVDGKLGRANLKLRSNQKIVYLRPDYLEPEVDPYFEIIFEDDALIALSKSGNLPTSPSGKYFKNTLVSLIKAQFGWKKLYTLHRLDRETSGVIVFAKRHEIAQTMAAHFRNKRINKIYSAVLSNHLPDNAEQEVTEVYISLPIGQDIKSAIHIKQSVNPLGKTCQTHFREIKKMGDYSLVEVRTYTGRTHQIRVHAAHLGCAIVGDKLYGLPNDGFINWLSEGDDYLRAQNFPLHRQLLHALEIRFPHPVTTEEVVIRAEDKNLISELNQSL
ncbi:MAG: RluA family pseudouridine synthase [Deltaproteobacteria bacterium]|nr:RluA family pseudouridine synthase [Deltaproteobacteria bacterium]